MATYLDKAIQLINDQIEWAEKQLLAEQTTSCCFPQEQTLPETTLTWTEKKTDLIELLYALDASGCFNFGKASLNQTACYFEKVFHTSLSNFPRDFYEMRIRNNKTPFMDGIRNLLRKRMDNPTLYRARSNTGW